MNFDKYQQLAFRTCKDKGSMEMNLIHMALGIHSEYDELFTAIQNNDKVNVAEEIADHFWYIAGFCTFKGWSLYGLMSDDIDHILTLAQATSILQDLVKKEVIYGKTMDQKDIYEILYKIASCLVEIADDWDIKVEDTLDTNIAKLKIRYPDKYTDDKAINRDLLSERKELEK